MVDLDQIRRVIVNTIDKPFGVRELAETLGMSESHLRDLCCEKYQMSPALIIETVRLEMAIDLLKHNKLKIYQICRRAGYQNLKTFRNAFKKRFGMTPAEFRRNGAQLDAKELRRILWGDGVEMFRR